MLFQESYWYFFPVCLTQIYQFSLKLDSQHVHQVLQSRQQQTTKTTLKEKQSHQPNQLDALLPLNYKLVTKPQLQ